MVNRRPVLKRLFGRCEFPRCWRGWTVEAVLKRQSGAESTTQRFCDQHGDRLTARAMRGADRVRVYDDDSGGMTELLGFDAAVRKLQVQEGLSQREARRKLERQRGRR